MSAVFFIGDELSATGFRLAGLEILGAAGGEASAMLAEARRGAGAVLIAAAAAAEVQKQELDEALLALRSPTAIVPDILGAALPPDLARRLKVTLGIEG
ncbi:MAG: V-type ATP synthase subunit F [Rhodomicrobium sp.]